MNSPTPQPSLAGKLISYEALQRFTAKTLQLAGLSAADAETGAQALTLTDAWGVVTHGTKSLAGYLRRLKGGGLRAQGKPHLAAEGPGWAIVDGDSALAMVTSTFAMQTAVTKARQCGIAYVGVRNSCHYGAAGVYTWQAARQGLVGLSMANDRPSVAAPGARGGITGSNPFAYAVPAGRYRAIMLDMSVATAAGQKVWVASTRGESIPDTWGLDSTGRPTTDPNQVLNGGCLQPAAGHKGYGLALLVETLAGVLSGAGVTYGVESWMFADTAKPTHHGAAFIAIDVAAIMPGTRFIQRVEALVDEIHQAPRAAGVDRLYVPGEKEWECYDRSTREGLRLPVDVLESLEAAAQLSGLNLEAELNPVVP